MRTVRDLVKRRIEPQASAVDADAQFPAEGYRALASVGAVALHLPEPVGGGSAGIATSVRLIDEVGRTCGSTAALLSAAIPAMTALGSAGTLVPDLVDRFAAGGEIPVWVAGGIVASRVGDELILRGQASWVAGAESATGFVSVATIEGTDDVALCYVESGHPGLRIGELPTDLGLRGCGFRTLELQDVAVPALLQLSSGAAARTTVQNAIDHHWLALAAVAIGLGTGALQEARAYASERTQFGRPIGEFPAVRAILANAWSRMAAARQLVLAVATNYDAGLVDGGIAAALLEATEAAADASIEAVQVFGGYGFVKDYPAERFMRDAHVTRILADSLGDLRCLVGS